MTSQMIIRIDSNLKSKVDRFAKSEGKSVSVVVRELLENYVKDRDISLYVDDLWNRIGSKIKESGYSNKNIDAVINESRESK